jgi:hypothetical protein
MERDGKEALGKGRERECRNTSYVVEDGVLARRMFRFVLLGVSRSNARQIMRETILVEAEAE